jgi:hypothetical protein
MTEADPRRMTKEGAQDDQWGAYILRCARNGSGGCGVGMCASCSSYLRDTILEVTP